MITLSCSPGSKSALTVIPTAMGVAALTLAQAASAQATPPNNEAQSPSWTVAMASPVAQGHGNNVALGNMALGHTARWATMIGQIQPQEAPICCFSDLDRRDLDRRDLEIRDLALGNVENIGSTIDETWTQHQVYIMLALTFWFGTTAPWILRQFWFSQQRLANGGPVNRLRRRRSVTGASVTEASVTQSGSRAVSHSKQYRAVPLHENQMPQRFAGPRVAPVARPQGWEVDRRPNRRTVVDVAADMLASPGQSGRSQPKLQPAGVC